MGAGDSLMHACCTSDREAFPPVEPRSRATPGSGSASQLILAWHMDPSAGNRRRAANKARDGLGNQRESVGVVEITPEIMQGYSEAHRRPAQALMSLSRLEPPPTRPSTCAAAPAKCVRFVQCATEAAAPKSRLAKAGQPASRVTQMTRDGEAPSARSARSSLQGKSEDLIGELQGAVTRADGRG